MKLQDYITQSGLTDAQFAERVGVSQPHINKIRRGVVSPSLSVAERIMEATNGKVTPNDFLREVTA